MNRWMDGWMDGSMDGEVVDGMRWRDSMDDG